MHFRPRQDEFEEDQLVPRNQLEEAWEEEQASWEDNEEASEEEASEEQSSEESSEDEGDVSEMDQ